MLSDIEVSLPRLRLATQLSSSTVLDGSWWPRSTDPVRELPGLILMLNNEIGTVRSLMLAATEWDSHPKQLIVDDQVIRLGWYASQPRGLLIVTGEAARVDLLVIPPLTSPGLADTAGSMASHPHNTWRTPRILADADAAVAPSGEAVWEGEGGQLREGP